MDTTQPPDRIDAIREFNRFYTARIGVVRDHILASRFSLTEARVLFELVHDDGLTASDLTARLDLDAGYLSRILRRFQTEGLLARAPSVEDRRQQILRLTDAGQAAYAPLDRDARDAVAALLAPLREDARDELLAHMRAITGLLREDRRAPWHIRAPRPGDIGWVVARHGALYAQEYQFNERFEGLVGRVAGDFLTAHDPERERCWIAEQAGVRLGSVFLMRKDDLTGKLRLLLVEPSARGLGIGKALVTTCIEAARAAGYQRLVLWTNDILLAARGIYRDAGFRLVASAPHADFGPAMVGEDWELDLTTS